MRTRPDIWTVFRLSIVTSVLLVFSVACMGNDTEVAETDQGVTASPTALAELPADIEVANITIKDGMFSVAEVIVQQGTPSILDVVNQDDRAYRLKIDDLVAPTDIAADATTRVSFTTPKVDRYQAELLASDSDDVLAQITLNVIGPGGTQP